MKQISVLFFMLGISLSALAGEWRIPGERVFLRPTFCPLAGEAELIYPVCNDQVAKLDDAIKAAKAAGKELIVQFGATWCGYTKLNHAFWTTGGVLDAVGKDGKPLSDRYAYVGIALNTRVNGQRTQVDSGMEAMDYLWATEGKTGREGGFTGFPFVTIFDPSGKRTAESFDTPYNETPDSFGYDLPATVKALTERP